MMLGLWMKDEYWHMEKLYQYVFSMWILIVALCFRKGSYFSWGCHNKYHRLGIFNYRNLFSHSSGSYKVEDRSGGVWFPVKGLSSRRADSCFLASCSQGLS